MVILVCFFFVFFALFSLLSISVFIFLFLLVLFLLFALVFGFFGCFFFSCFFFSFYFNLFVSFFLLLFGLVFITCHGFSLFSSLFLLFVSFCYFSWVLFDCLFAFFSFLGGGACCTSCGVLLPQPGLRPGPQEWEHQVQDSGPPEISQPQGIFIIMSSPRGPHLGTNRWLHPTSCKLQCWMP